jgi:iron(III) transport system permease protein
MAIQEADGKETADSGRFFRRIANRSPLLVKWGFSVLLFVLLISPMLPIIYQGFIDRPLYEDDPSFTVGNFQRLFSDPRFFSALWNTVILAVFGTLISTMIGFFAALLFERFRLPFQRTLKLLFLAPMFLSSLILAFAWSMIYGRAGYVSLFLRSVFGFGLPELNSLGGISLLAGVSAAPISYIYFASSMRNIPTSLEQAARTVGATPVRAIMAVVFPLMLPSFLYCIMLNFVMKIDLLAVPLVLGAPVRIEVLATYLYQKGMIEQIDYGLVSSAAIVMLLIVQAMVFFQNVVIGDTRKYNTIGGRGGRNQKISLGLLGWVIALLILLYCALTSLIPCLYLVLRAFTTLISPYVPLRDSLTLENFQLVFGYDAYIQSIYNTIIVSVIGGAAAVVITFIGAIVAYRSPPGLRSFTEQVSFIPRAIPGLVVGIGIFYATILLPGSGWIRGSLLILMIAYVIRYYPTGFAAISPSLHQIGQDMERAVRIVGGSELRSYITVTLPLMRHALLACFFLYFIHFFKEYAAASFLFGPDTAVVGTTMLQLDLMGNHGDHCADRRLCFHATGRLRWWLR